MNTEVYEFSVADGTATRTAVGQRGSFALEFSIMIACCCPECGYRYEIADELAGKKVLCPECQTRFKPKSIPRVVGTAQAPMDDGSHSDESPRKRMHGVSALGVAAVLGVFATLLVVFLIGFLFKAGTQPAKLPSLPIAVREETLAPKQSEGPGLPERPAKPVNNQPGKPAGHPPETLAIKVEPSELFASYRKDVVAADKKYTGQMVELGNVSGKVQKDGDGRYYLVAAERARFVKRKDQGPRITGLVEHWQRLQQSALNTKYVPGIILYLDPEEAEKFSGLGDKMVTVRGKCKGMTVDEKTEPGYVVTLESVGLQFENSSRRVK